MIKLKHRQTGFTIVELLIVIVVIGILAAITIVAYNGIQTRAENSKTLSAMEGYAKGLSLYALNTGSYPVEPSVPCLGAYPQTTCAEVDTSTGSTCFGFGGANSQVSFDTKMKTVFGGAVPQPSSQVMNCGGKLFGGAWYFSSDGKTANLTYLLRGNQSCGVGGLISTGQSFLSDTTVCTASMATP